MDSSQIPIIQAIAAKLKHLSARQQVISQNIANADTPGYRARDVDAPDFGALLAKTGAAADGKPRVGKPTVQVSARMTELGSTANERNASALERNVTETKPSGNDVVLEDQLMKLADVQMEYSALTNLYRKQTGMLKTALGRGGA